MTARAIVTYGPAEIEGQWRVEPIQLRSLRPTELRVRVVATGICHTDLLVAKVASAFGGYPRVLGHEGSGYVEEVGENVTVAEKGDPVLLSFPSCQTCQICKDGHPAHCLKSGELAFVGSLDFAPAFSSTPTDYPIRGSFFGQSSFASTTIVSQTSVVNVKDLIRSEEELKLFSPLGCGLQTGSATITNVADAKISDTVVIMGLGAVGLSAIMTAKAVGCRTIIGVDRVPSRLVLAKGLGATHVLDTEEMEDLKLLVQEVRSLTEGVGSNITIDSTGVLKLIEVGIEFTRPKGKYVQVGSTAMDAALRLPMFQFMTTGKSIIGTIEGDAIPEIHIPRMIQWYRDGAFPIEKLVKIFPVDQFQQGLHEMHSGETVKPVISW